MRINRFAKRLVMICLLTAISLFFISCTAENNTTHIDFSLHWGINGISSYDSKTGILIKTTDTINLNEDDYKSQLFLSNEQRSKIDKILINLNIESYPDSYDPYKEGDVYTSSSPSRDIILTVGEKTITCSDIALSGTSAGEKGRSFLKAVDEITEIITSTSEWQSLPEYEVLYS